MLRSNTSVRDRANRSSVRAFTTALAFSLLAVAGSMNSRHVCAQTFDSGVVNLAIPDNNGAGITTTITVPDGTGTVLDVNALLNINHTFVGDLILRLTSPNGTTVVLVDRLSHPEINFGDGEDLIGSYEFDDDTANTLPTSPGVAGPPIPPGIYQAEGLLSDFDGETADGDWILFLSDNGPADTGTLNFWQLILAAMPPEGGEIFGTTPQVTVNTLNLQYRLMSEQISDIVRNARLNGGSTFVSVARRPAASRVAASSKKGDIQLTGYQTTSPDFVFVDGNSRYTNNGWNGWVTGYGTGGMADGSGALGSLDYAGGGTQFGIYNQLDRDTLAGVFGGYGHQNVDLAVPRESSSVDTGMLGGFIRHGCYCNYTLMAASLGYDSFDTSRLTNGGVANGDYDGIQGSAYIERGWVKRWRNLELSPAAALQYVGLHQYSFTESGPGAVFVDGTDTHSLRSIVGLDVRGEKKRTRLGAANWEVRGHWMHEYLETNTLINGSLGGSVFTRNGLDFGRDWALLGTGLRLQASDRLSFFAGYDLQINDRQESHSGSGTVTFQY